jgi:hypothetical protein
MKQDKPIRAESVDGNKYILAALAILKGGLNMNTRNTIPVFTGLILAALLPLIANSQPPTQGLVAYYPFTENANDESGNGNHGIVHGATLTTDRFGNPGSAYDFDGLDDYISIGSGSSLLITGDLTIALWTRLDSLPQPGTIDPLVTRGEWGETEDVNHPFHFYAINTGSATYLGNSHEHGPGINTQVTSNRPLSQQTWLHVVLVRNSNAQTYQFYVNGVPESLQEYQYNPTGGSNTSAYIGWSPADFHRYLDGILDEIRVYNRALTDAEVQAIYNTSPGRLMAYYPFNGNANDESGNGNDGVVLGATLTADRFGNANAAYDFDGDDFINIGSDNSLLITGNLSISMWARIRTMPESGTFDPLVARGEWGETEDLNNVWNLHIMNIGGQTYLRHSHEHGQGINTDLISTRPLEDQTWVHVGVVRDASARTYRFYVNGIPELDQHYQNNPTGGTNTSGFIGWAPWGIINYFDGAFDDIRVYNRVLSDQEMDSLYLEGGWTLEPEFGLSVDTLYAFPGDTIMVPVKVQFPMDSTYSSAEITFIGYHGLLDFIQIETDSSLIGTAGWIVQVNETDSLLVTAAAGGQDISGNGVLFWLEFAVLDTSSDFIPIAIESALFNESSIPTIMRPGGVHVIGYVAGDVSLDGEVHAFDASLILKYLVGTLTLNPQQLNNANVSSDTTVSALDASLILQFVVGLLDSLPYDTSNGLLLASGDIGMEDREVQPGETIEIPLNLSSGSNILSFYGLVTFNPEHLVYAGVVWSQLLNDFLIETNTQLGEIKFSGACPIPDGEEEVFATLQFTLANTFNANETVVGLQKLRWNENPEMENVASARLSIVLTADDKFGLPTEFSLKQNFPNPFNPGTNIRYELPKKEYVRLTVYDVIGKEVAVLVDQEQPVGKYDVKFNGVDLGSGVYFYRIQAGDYVATKKLLLLK